MSKIDVFDDIHEIANIEKKIPEAWIDTKNNYVKQELIRKKANVTKNSKQIF